MEMEKDGINGLTYGFLGENCDKHALSLNHESKPWVLNLA